MAERYPVARVDVSPAIAERRGSMKRLWLGILIAVVGALLLAAGCQATRGAYESAPYRLVRSEGKFAVRDYPALTVVETPMAGSDRGDGSFMRLFRFITGENARKQQIAMTTPVFQSGGPANPTMAFVLPAKLSAAAAPSPTDQTLTVRELPAGRFAVLRFSGGRNAQNEAEALARLRAWMVEEGLTSRSGPVYGYFDPPWTPVFLRRNEVMLRIDGHKPD